MSTWTIAAALVLLAQGCGGAGDTEDVDGAGGSSIMAAGGNENPQPADATTPSADGAMDGSGSPTADGDDAEAIDGGADVVPVEDVAVPTGPLGGERPAPVFLPDDYTASKDWPLLVLLHGFSATGAIQDMYLGVSKRVTEKGFVLIIPEGTKNSAGNQFWNAMVTCCDFEGSGVDDVAYLRGLIEEAQSLYSIDPDRVYLYGHSNGGFMGYRMACDAADLITGIASIAGSTYKAKVICTPSEAVTVLQIHGTEDASIAYNGDLYNPSAQKTVEQWVDFNNCSAGEPVTSEPVDFDMAVDGPETTQVTWSDCANGSGVALWTMEGTSHIPGFNDSFTPAVLDYLFGHAH